MQYLGLPLALNVRCAIDCTTLLVCAFLFVKSLVYPILDSTHFCNAEISARGQEIIQL